MRPYRTAAVLFLAASLASAREVPKGVSYLDNGTLKIGVDLELGGAITHLGPSGTDQNLINSHDWGRQIQMSHYSGPVPFVKDGKEPKKEWAGLGWNPIQSGDCFGNRSRVLEHSNDGRVLYVKCIPMQWPLDGVPGECTFEWWIELEANTAQVRSRLVNRRPDRTQYPARDQELPAVYVNGPWYRLVAYLGDRPFEGKPVTELTRKGDPAGWPWLRFLAPERWAALLDDADRGLGIWHPEALTYAGGFHGGDAGKGKGGVRGGQTGYVSPVRHEILDHDIVTENRFVLILGTLAEIRNYAAARPRPDPAPSFRFDGDRRHWWLERATDSGFPTPGELRITAPAEGAALVGPPMFWRAGDAPTLHVEAAFGAGAKEAAVAFAPFGDDNRRGWDQWGPGTRKPYAWPETIRFPVDGDGKLRVYKVRLADHPAYRGAMRGLRILLPPSPEPCRVRYIGVTPP